MKQAFRFRFEPTDEQATLLSRTFGCARLVYNPGLAARLEAWESRRERLGYNAASAMLTAWKKSEETKLVTASRPMPSITDTEGAVANPRHGQRERDRLAKAQRTLARKCKGSKNQAKVRLRVGRLHARAADRRRDFLHKLTTDLVRENQTLVIEDLAVGNIRRNHRIAQAVSDVSWAELRQMLEYKCSWYGRELIVLDRFHPSSKTCSACGQVKAHLSWSDRVYRCDDPACGLVLDRDVNAARTILAAGLAVSVCGDRVKTDPRHFGAEARTPVDEPERPAGDRGNPLPAGGGRGHNGISVTETSLGTAAAHGSAPRQERPRRR